MRFPTMVFVLALAGALLPKPARAQFFLESARTIQPRHGYLDVSYVRSGEANGYADRFGNTLLRLPVNSRIEARLAPGSVVFRQGEATTESSGIGGKVALLPIRGVRPGLTFTGSVPMPTSERVRRAHDASLSFGASSDFGHGVTAGALVGERVFPAPGAKPATLLGFGPSIERGRFILGGDWMAETYADAPPSHLVDVGMFVDVDIGLAYVWVWRAPAGGRPSVGVGLIRTWGPKS